MILEMRLSKCEYPTFGYCKIEALNITCSNIIDGTHVGERATMNVIHHLQF